MNFCIVSPKQRTNARIVSETLVFICNRIFKFIYYQEIINLIRYRAVKPFSDHSLVVNQHPDEAAHFFSESCVLHNVILVRTGVEVPDEVSHFGHCGDDKERLGLQSSYKSRESTLTFLASIDDVTKHAFDVAGAPSKEGVSNIDLFLAFCH